MRPSSLSDLARYKGKRRGHRCLSVPMSSRTWNKGDLKVSGDPRNASSNSAALPRRQLPFLSNNNDSTVRFAKTYVMALPIVCLLDTWQPDTSTSDAYTFHDFNLFLICGHIFGIIAPSSQAMLSISRLAAEFVL